MAFIHAPDSPTVSWKGMKHFCLVLCGSVLFGAVLLGSDLGSVRSVYLLPMGRGLDQYLANRITNEHVFQVVTDPNRAFNRGQNPVALSGGGEGMGMPSMDRAMILSNAPSAQHAESTTTRIGKPIKIMSRLKPRLKPVVRKTKYAPPVGNASSR